VTSRRTLLDRLLQRGAPTPVLDFAPPPTSVAPDLWSLERLLRMPGGPRLPTRTTIVRLASGGLLVVSPPPSEPGGLEAIDALGPVEEILVPNSFHYLYAPAFAARHPGAKLRVAPGLPARVPDFPPAEEIAAATVSPWGTGIEHRVLGPVRGVSEVALFHRASVTLVVTDLAFHVRRYQSALERVAWRLLGVPAGFGPSRSARLVLLRDRAAVAAFLAEVLEWPFRHVLVAHGEPLEDHAHETFRRAFASYLPGA